VAISARPSVATPTQLARSAASRSSSRAFAEGLGVLAIVVGLLAIFIQPS
jgi:hypothetical protein